MDLEARRDFYGSGKANQAIVCALMQGPEADCAHRGSQESDHQAELEKVFEAESIRESVLLITGGKTETA
jgi:hypothetical protein